MTTDTKTGRTLYDFISEHPRWILIAFIFLAALLIFVVWNGNSFSVGGIQVSSEKPESLIDTVVVVKRETILVEVPKTVIKYRDAPKPKTSVQKGNTKIEVAGQPSNINTGTNSGIVGNNNTINNFMDKPIALEEGDQAQLIRLVNLELRKLPRDKVRLVEVTGMVGNARSLQLAQIIYNFLTKEGYNIIGGGIKQAIYASPWNGTVVLSNGTTVEVKVGIV